MGRGGYKVHTSQIERGGFLSDYLAFVRLFRSFRHETNILLSPRVSQKKLIVILRHARRFAFVRLFRSFRHEIK